MAADLSCDVTSFIVNADSNAQVTGPCIVWSVSQGPNTAGTDTSYELYDALTVTGSPKVLTRTLSIPMVLTFPKGLKFKTGITVDKTNAGDSKVMVVYSTVSV